MSIQANGSYSKKQLSLEHWKKYSESEGSHTYVRTLPFKSPIPIGEVRHFFIENKVPGTKLTAKDISDSGIELGQFGKWDFESTKSEGQIFVKDWVETNRLVILWINSLPPSDGNNSRNKFGISLAILRRDYLSGLVPEAYHLMYALSLIDQNKAGAKQKSSKSFNLSPLIEATSKLVFANSAYAGATESITDKIDEVGDDITGALNSSTDSLWDIYDDFTGRWESLSSTVQQISPLEIAAAAGGLSVAVGMAEQIGSGIVTGVTGAIGQLLGEGLSALAKWASGQDRRQFLSTYRQGISDYLKLAQDLIMAERKIMDFVMEKQDVLLSVPATAIAKAKIAINYLNQKIESGQCKDQETKLRAEISKFDTIIDRFRSMYFTGCKGMRLQIAQIFGIEDSLIKLGSELRDNQIKYRKMLAQDYRSGNSKAVDINSRYDEKVENRRVVGQDAKEDRELCFTPLERNFGKGVAGVYESCMKWKYFVNAKKDIKFQEEICQKDAVTFALNPDKKLLKHHISLFSRTPATKDAAARLEKLGKDTLSTDLIGAIKACETHFNESKKAGLVASENAKPEVAKDGNLMLYQGQVRSVQLTIRDFEELRNCLGGGELCTKDNPYYRIGSGMDSLLTYLSPESENGLCTSEKLDSEIVAAMDQEAKDPAAAKSSP